MKKIIALAALALAMMATTSHAFSLNGYVGPVEFKINGVTKSADTTYAYTGKESLAAPGETWGIFNLSAITDGSNNIWSQSGNDNVYGIIYGLYDYAYGPGLNGVSIEQVGGSFAMYQVPATFNFDAVGPAGRMGQAGFAGISNVGTLLLSGNFASGVQPGSPATLVQDVTTTQAPANGKGIGYGDVTGGSFFNTFDSNTMLGGHDLLFDFTVLFPSVGSPWSQRINDPVSGAAVPEPGTIVLFGLGMAGLAVFGKRRLNKKA